MKHGQLRCTDSWGGSWTAEEEDEVVSVNNPNVSIIWCYSNFLIWLSKC
jgi:hypothetical protein